MPEEKFRWMLNGMRSLPDSICIEDPMASDLLSDGIRRFARDTEKLEAFLATKL